MADLLVSEGYADVGYEFINVDDCWLEKTRGSRGELVPDRKRFPRGMKSLGQYVSFFNKADGFSKRFARKFEFQMFFILFNKIHSRGLKFGIYQDFGKSINFS